MDVTRGVKLASGFTPSESSGHQRSAQSAESGRSPPSSARNSFSTQHNHLRRAYDSYKPGRADETAAQSASLNSPTGPNVTLPTGSKQPPNAPKGPSHPQRFRNRSWVAPQPAAEITPKPPRIAEVEVSTKSAPRWGGEDYLPTPASPALSTHSSTGQRDQTPLFFRDDHDEALDVSADTMDLDVNQVAYLKEPVRPDTQFTPIAPAAPMGSNEARRSTSSAADNGVMLTSTTPTHIRSDTSIVSAEMWNQWKKLTDEKDAYLLGLVLSQQAQDAQKKRLQRLKEDSARFALLAFDQQYKSKLAADMKEQETEVEKAGEKMSEYIMKRHQISEELATLQKRIFAGALHQSSQIEGQPVTSAGPSHADFDELRKELAEVKKSSVLAKAGPSQAQFDALRSELAELKKHSSRQQKEGVQLDALKTTVDELKKQISSISYTTTSSTIQAKLTAIIFRVEKLETTLNSQKRPDSSLEASRQELSSQISKLTESIKKVEQDAHDARADARLAKEKAQTVHTNLSDKFSKIENDFEELSAQVEDNVQPKGPATEISQPLRESLCAELEKSEAVKSLQNSVRNLDQTSQDIRHQLGEVKVALESHSRALASVDQVSNDLDHSRGEIEEHARQLKAIQADVERAKDARARLSPATQTAPPGHPQNIMDTSRQPPSGPVQGQADQLAGVTQQTQAVMSRLVELEAAMTHITRRLDQTSMSPQAKAILAVMLQQVPNGPQIKDEFEQARRQRHEVANQLSSQRQALVPLEQMQQAMSARLDVIEEATNREQTSVTSDLWTAIDDLRSKVLTSRDALREEVRPSNPDLNGRLDQLDEKLAVCESWIKKHTPDMGARLTELKDLLTESNIHKLQQLSEDVPRKSQTPASPALQPPGQQHSSKTESVKMTAFQKHSRPKSSSDTGTIRNARAGQTRTLSERESSAEDSDDTPMIDIPKMPKAQPEQISSQTPSLPSRPASTNETNPSPQMTKKLFNKRQKLGK